jgi:hypothetical protein
MSGTQPKEVTPQGTLGEGASTLTHELEQEFITAPVSSELSREGAGYLTTADKGKGRAQDVSFQYDDLSSLREENWATLDKSTMNLSVQVHQLRQEAASTHIELVGIRSMLEDSQSMMEDSRHRSKDMFEAIQALTMCVCTKDTDHPAEMRESYSPRALATRALYAEHGPTEESEDFA